jgi:hypothetical protein
MAGSRQCDPPKKAERLAPRERFDAAKKNGPSRGHSCVDLLVFVVMMPSDYHLVTVMTPAFVPAVVAMLAGLGPRTEVIMIAVAIVVAVADHDVLGACDRRRGDRDGAECGNHISKLLHVVLLHQ